MVDLTVDYVNIRDESIPQRDGTLSRSKRYEFYLGKFGPFTERVPLADPFDEQEITRRITALQNHLRAIHPV